LIPGHASLQWVVNALAALPAETPVGQAAQHAPDEREGHGDGPEFVGKARRAGFIVEAHVEIGVCGRAGGGFGGVADALEAVQMELFEVHQCFALCRFRRLPLPTGLEILR